MEYQLPFMSTEMAMKALERDHYESADSMIIKPASHFMDIIYCAKKSMKPVLLVHIMY